MRYLQILIALVLAQELLRKDTAMQLILWYGEKVGSTNPVGKRFEHGTIFGYFFFCYNNSLGFNFNSKH